MAAIAAGGVVAYENEELLVKCKYRENRVWGKVRLYYIGIGKYEIPLLGSTKESVVLVWAYILSEAHKLFCQKKNFRTGCFYMYFFCLQTYMSLLYDFKHLRKYIFNANKAHFQFIFEQLAVILQRCNGSIHSVFFGLCK